MFQRQQRPAPKEDCKSNNGKYGTRDTHEVHPGCAQGCNSGRGLAYWSIINVCFVVVGVVSYVRGERERISPETGLRVSAAVRAEAKDAGLLSQRSAR